MKEVWLIPGKIKTNRAVFYRYGELDLPYSLVRTHRLFPISLYRGVSVLI